MTTLNNKVTIYFPIVPYVPNVPNVLNGNELLREVKCRFIQMFGGCTSIKAEGSWINSNNQLIEDEIVLISSACTDQQLVDNYEKIYNIASNIAIELKQECIAVEINGTLTFVH